MSFGDAPKDVDEACAAYLGKHDVKTIFAEAVTDLLKDVASPDKTAPEKPLLAIIKYWVNKNRLSQSDLQELIQNLSAAPAEDSDDEDDDEDEDDFDGAAEMAPIVKPKGRNPRRVSVSAASVDPEEMKRKMEEAMNQGKDGAEYKKTNDERELIKKSLKSLFSFSTLEPEELEKVVDCMFKRKVDAGTEIITQGDMVADEFYVMNAGECGVSVTVEEVKEEYKNGEFWSAQDVKEDPKRGEGEKTGETKKETVTKEVMVCTAANANYFGDLALLYTQPRKATVTAKSATEVWVMDRLTFKAAAVTSSMDKRTKYVGFLQSVPLMKGLTNDEYCTIADGLKEVEVTAGSDLIKEGESGDTFYVVKKGALHVYKNGEKLGDEYGAGDFFGELALVRDGIRAATIKCPAGGDSAYVLAIDREEFTNVLGDAKAIGERMYSN